MSPDRTLTIINRPRMSWLDWLSVLNNDPAYRQRGARPSPAAPSAGKLWDTCVNYGVDPAVALAWYFQESQLGTDPGRLAGYNTWGNVRTVYDVAGCKGARNVPQPDGNHFAWYPNIEMSLDDWCKRMVYQYVLRDGLTLVDDAMGVYAPTSDHNRVQDRIEKMYRIVGWWR